MLAALIFLFEARSGPVSRLAGDQRSPPRGALLGPRRPRALAACLVSAALAGAVGCGPSLPIPRERLTTAEAELAEAVRAGAPRVPKAKESYAAAAARITRARAFIREGKNGEASLLLLRAESEASLASALAREGVAEEKIARAKALIAEEERLQGRKAP
jgi:hypothetical protein